MSFGRNVEECNEFVSSSIEQRAADLHDAVRDPSVKAILTVIGGYNSNQLLPFIDWNLISANPKVFCCCFDITALRALWQGRYGAVDQRAMSMYEVASVPGDGVLRISMKTWSKLVGKRHISNWSISLFACRRNNRISWCHSSSESRSSSQLIPPRSLER